MAASPARQAGHRTVRPVGHTTIALLDHWVDERGIQRAQPHPRDATPTDFLFVHLGRRIGWVRIRNRLNATGLAGTDGNPLAVTPHQTAPHLRLPGGYPNAGMSLQALMALLGHVTQR